MTFNVARLSLLGSPALKMSRVGSNVGHVLDGNYWAWGGQFSAAINRARRFGRRFTRLRESGGNPHRRWCKASYCSRYRVELELPANARDVHVDHSCASRPNVVSGPNGLEDCIARLHGTRILKKWNNARSKSRGLSLACSPLNLTDPNRGSKIAPKTSRSEESGTHHHAAPTWKFH
jgi:hypothetical protein